jgi:hypothetical protein
MQKLAKLGKPWCQCSLGVAYLYEYYRILWWRERRFASWRESSNVLAGSPLLLRRAPVNTAKSLFFQIITAPLDDTILVSFTRRN